MLNLSRMILHLFAQRAAGNTDPLRYELCIIHRDGSDRWLDVTHAIVEFGTHPASLLVLSDITDHKQAQHERQRAFDALERANTQLERNHTLLRAILDSIDDGLLLLYHDGTVLAANQMFATLFGVVPSQVEGLAWPTIRATSAVELPALPFHDVVCSGKAHQWEQTVMTLDGVRRLLACSLLPVPGAQAGTVEQVVLHMVDRTSEKRLEAMVIDSETLRSKRLLTEMIVHEVISPLQNLGFLLELLPDERKHQREASIRTALKELVRIGHVIGQLRSVYRPTEENRDTLVDVNEVVEHVRLLNEKQLAKRAMTIEVATTSEHCLVPGRAGELTQVLLNLVSNAMHVMPEAGRLRLGTRLAQPGELPASIGAPAVVVEVHDSGPGIPPQHLPYIFEQYFSTRSGGTGLGLSICRTIVERHGGIITASNHPDGGALFQILLPMIFTHPEEGRREEG